jgi:hypothetical protein
LFFMLLLCCYNKKSVVLKLTRPLDGSVCSFPSPRFSKFCAKRPVDMSPCKCTCMLVVSFMMCTDRQPLWMTTPARP